MEKKEKSAAGMGLTARTKVAYGIGAVGKDMVYMLVASYILYYYNSVLGVSSVFIGTVLMAARVFDAFNDPIMGIVVAKTKTRWGRFRPWIFTGTVLNAVVLYAMFAVPESMGDGGMKAFLTVTYFAWGITYTLMDIPYWSMIPAITEPGKERENLSALARSCAGIGSAIPTVLTMIIVPAISGMYVAAEKLNITDYRIGFKWWALLVAVIFVISEAVCVANVKEKDQVNVEAHGIGEMFRSLVTNDQALAVVVTIVLVNSALYITSNLLIYYFTYDIGSESGYALFSAFGGGAQILAMMLFPLFRKKMSKRKLFVHAVVYEIVGYALLLGCSLAGVTRMTVYGFACWYVLFIPGLLVFAGSGLLNVLITVCLADSIDYGEFKNGQRDESVICSMQTFVVKLASGVAVFFAGLAIKWVGLVQPEAGSSEVIQQSNATLAGLSMVMTVVPMVLLVIGLIFFVKKYTLTEEKMKEIMDAQNGGR